MPNTTSRLFAVIPAAGHSRRMGQPKLLLPVGDRTVIACVLDVLCRPELTQTVVVVRHDDDPLREAIHRAGVTAITPSPPPAEMRQSVEYGLRWLENEYHPSQNDGWILSPADHPLLDADVLTQLLDRWRVGDCRILIPTCRGRRGHPTIFRWNLVAEVFSLPADAGLNQIVRRYAAKVVEVETGNPAILVDLDTPEDYAGVLKITNDEIRMSNQ